MYSYNQKLYYNNIFNYQNANSYHKRNVCKKKIIKYKQKYTISVINLLYNKDIYCKYLHHEILSYLDIFYIKKKLICFEEMLIAFKSKKYNLLYFDYNNKSIYVEYNNSRILNYNYNKEQDMLQINTEINFNPYNTDVTFNYIGFL